MYSAFKKQYWIIIDTCHIYKNGYRYILLTTYSETSLNKTPFSPQAPLYMYQHSLSHNLFILVYLTLLNRNPL